MGTLYLIFFLWHSIKHTKTSPGGFGAEHSCENLSSFHKYWKECSSKMMHWKIEADITVEPLSTDIVSTVNTKHEECQPICKEMPDCVAYVWKVRLECFCRII